MATKKQIAKMNIRERAQHLMEDERKLSEKYGLAKKLIVMFPYHNRVPLRGRLGRWLINSSGGVLDTQFIDSNEQNHG